jgi:hypothetical protein
MTPWVLFEYVLAIVCGLGIGALIVLFIWSLFTD